MFTTGGLLIGGMFTTGGLLIGGMFTTRGLLLGGMFTTGSLLMGGMFITGGLLMGGMFSTSAFLTWMVTILFHLTGLTLFSVTTCFTSTPFQKISVLSSTMICSPECDAHYLLGLGFSTELHQYCSHSTYCLNRACTQKIFSRSVMHFRLASSIIMFLSMFTLISAL